MLGGKRNKKSSEIFCQRFDEILTNKKSTKKDVHQGSAQNTTLDKIWEGAEEGIAKLRGEKTFALGQKIPASVKLFSRQ